VDEHSVPIRFFLFRLILYTVLTPLKGCLKFSDTLPIFMKKNYDNVAFINIDSDLYSSAKTILTVLNEQIVEGVINIILTRGTQKIGYLLLEG
jgi:hypothetical protein